jgi:hypothetical protein
MVSNMANDDNTTPLGLWHLALNYLCAAKILKDADPNPWVAANVSYQCACQGIDLVFKSYLLARGLTPDQLKLDIGHSLVACMNAAVQNGLAPLKAEHASAVEMIDASYREHEFRYMVAGPKRYPMISDLIDVGRDLLNGPAELVGGNTNNANRMRSEVADKLGISVNFNSR